MTGTITIIAAFALIAGGVDCNCSPPPDPFGGDTTPVQQGMLVDSWNEVREELIGDHAMLGACVDSTSVECGPANALWKIIAEAREEEGLTMIGHLNRAINLAIKPFEPSEWLTGLDAINADGDCKAYATAKYFALREAGVAPNRVRLVIVHELDHAEDHMVAAVYQNGGWLILNNLTMTLVSDVDEIRYTPMFVLDDNGVRLVSSAYRIGTPTLPFAPGL